MKIQIGKLLSITFGIPKEHQLEEIIMVRHGESTGNTREEDSNVVGDCNLRLTSKGICQAQTAGKKIGADALERGLVYASPYRRTRETAKQAIIGAGAANVRIFEDPRIREVEHGYKDVEAQEEKRKIHGWFYYRFEDGESPADCYDRTSAFLDSLSRQAERKNKNSAVIFTHGLTIRCLIARYLHLTVEEFETLANPQNGSIIRLAPTTTLTSPIYQNGRWGVEGIPLRN